MAQAHGSQQQNRFQYRWVSLFALVGAGYLITVSWAVLQCYSVHSRLGCGWPYFTATGDMPTDASS